MRALFDIGGELLALAAVLDECDGGEVPDEVDARLAVILSTELPQKLDRCLAFAAEKEMRAAAAVAEADQWFTRAKREKRQADWMMDRVRQVLEATGQTRVETAAGKVVSLQANGGPVPLEIDALTDPADYPTLARYRCEFDKDAIRAALARGDAVPFAKLGTRGLHLRVRT